MTHIFSPKPSEAAKWREQASKAAAYMKTVALTKDVMHIAFGFNDGIVTVKIPSSAIREKDEAALTDLIYNTVLLAAQTKGSA